MALKSSSGSGGPKKPTGEKKTGSELSKPTVKKAPDSLKAPVKKAPAEMTKSAEKKAAPQTVSSVSAKSPVKKAAASTVAAKTPAKKGGLTVSRIAKKPVSRPVSTIKKNELDQALEDAL